ncbi:hypothetical protein ACIRBX_35330 [Kitasatospora sp. NPDC096147]|uniref:hypothetical protein n=1 Tax=Kitasatospora sp. NPDC096147 TaxID=3364093 RepID=UPI0037F49C33
MSSNGLRPLPARRSAVPARRSAWQRFLRPGVDSGWVPLSAHFGLFLFLALRAFVGVLQGSGLFGLLALGFAGVAARTGYLLWRLAGRGRTGT